MRKIYTSFLALAMTMVSMVANAQYKAELTTDPVEGYYVGSVDFDPVELATALATDTATLHAAIDAISKENAESVFYLKTADGKTNVYTGNAGEFWMNNEGAPVAYGDGNTWYCGISYDPAGSDPDSGETWSESVSISMGQMPNTFKNIYTDSKLTATAYLVIGDKEVSFELIQNINAAPEPTLQAPVTELSKLNIVKEYTLELPFKLGKEYEGATYSATLEGIYEALGVSQAELDASVADYVLTQTVTATPILNEVGEETGEFIYALSDNLAKPDAAAGGAWYGRYINYDEASDSEVPLAISAPMDWGAGHNTFYTQNVTLVESVYSIVSGQYPGKLVEGDTDYTYHYIVVGDKAVKVKIQVNIIVPEKVDPNDMVKAGESSIDVEAKIDNNYATKSFTINMEEIVAALGCTTADFDDVFAYAQDGSISDNHTEGSGGFYYNADGKVENWGENAACFIARTSTSLEDGKFSIGQMTGAFTDITENAIVKPQLIFQYGAKFWVVTVNYTVLAPGQEGEGGGEGFEYKRVAQDAIQIQIVPSADTYPWGTTTQLDLDYIADKLGTTDFVYYTDGYTPPADDTQEGTWEFVSNKTLTDNAGDNGFWFGATSYENKEGVNVVTNVGWGTNSFGVGIENGVITWFQFPGQRVVGDEFNANLYAMNEATGEYVQYFLNVLYVEEVAPEAEVVLKEEAEIAVKESDFDEEGYIVYNIPTAGIYEALGLNDELIDAATLLVAKSAFVFTPVAAGEDALFNKDGFAIGEEEIDNLNVMGHFSTENGLQFIIDAQELTFEKGSEDCAVIRFAIEYDGKRAQAVYTFLSEDSPISGIEGTEAESSEAVEYYSLTGVKLDAPQKGVNIVKTADGKTKKVLF